MYTLVYPVRENGMHFFLLFIYVLTSINLKYLVNSIYFCTFASEIKNKKFNQLKVN